MHALWQGKIYSRSGKSEKYPDFRSSTGYGTGAGLCGWNCRHTFGPFIEGSPRVWSDEKLAELSAPKYEYRGEKFTEYEARQKEQYFNRQIHRWNREAEAMKAAGQDPAEAQAKVKSWKTRKADFVLNRAELPTAPIDNYPIDVKQEYYANAAPGKGKIVFEPGVDTDGKHKSEIVIATFLHDTFGGDITVLKETNVDKVKTPDFNWRGKLWDLKEPTTAKAADDRIRHGAKQISGNPGGIILNYKNSDVDKRELKEIIDTRAKRIGLEQFDVIIILDGKVNDILRYKK